MGCTAAKQKSQSPQQKLENLKIIEESKDEQNPIRVKNETSEKQAARDQQLSNNVQNHFQDSPDVNSIGLKQHRGSMRQLARPQSYNAVRKVKNNLTMFVAEYDKQKKQKSDGNLEKSQKPQNYSVKAQQDYNESKKQQQAAKEYFAQNGCQSVSGIALPREANGAQPKEHSSVLNPNDSISLQNAHQNIMPQIALDMLKK